MKRPTYDHLSEVQLRWAFAKVEEFVMKYNEKKDGELDDSDWKSITEEAIRFGDETCRKDQFCIDFILLALNYLQYSKKPKIEC
mgnify:CR=1 FL=1